MDYWVPGRRWSDPRSEGVLTTIEPGYTVLERPGVTRIVLYSSNWVNRNLVTVDNSFTVRRLVENIQ